MMAKLPDYCTPTTSFLAQISYSFHSCIPTPLAFLSTLLGYLSILSWLFAQAPQVFKNYTLKSASGLSIYFLAIWFLGDTSNLIGALFTGQAAWQVLVAAYYVSVDTLLLSQYIWYTYLKSKRNMRVGDDVGDCNEDDDSSIEILIESSTAEDEHSPNKPSFQTPEDGKLAVDKKAVAESRNSRKFSTRNITEKSIHNRNIIRVQSSGLPAASFPKALLVTSILCTVLVNASPLKVDPPDSPTGPQPYDELEFAGRIFSWISTVLYLGSRLPQLYKNFVRQSTSGLSPSLFIAAFFGNFFYSTSMVVNPLAWSSYPPYGGNGWAGPEGSDRITWISLAAPFWLGSAGVLVMDAAVGVQFLVYGEKRKAKIAIVRDERGRGKWRRVSGWMRGWIPSPSPARLVNEVGHDQRPLLREDGQDSSYGST